MKRGSPVHPFLFAMLPVLTVYVANLGQVHFSDILVPIGVALGSALALFLLACLILRNAGKAGIIASVGVLLFSFYGVILQAVAGRAPWLAPTLSVTVFVLTMGITVRTRWNLRRLTIILNVAAACVIAFQLIRILPYEIRHPDQGLVRTLPKVELLRPDDPPDIYYVVLDGYEGAGALNDIHHCNNSPFTGYLTSMGFFVPSEGHSNYCVTNLCLASILNMEYIDNLLDVDPHSGDLAALTPPIQNSRVLNLLSSVGYTTVQIGGTPFGPTTANPYADINFGTGSLTEFQNVLAQNSALRAFGIGNSPGTSRGQVLDSFDDWAKAARIEGPKFVFSHIMCPHFPYVFGPNGEPLEPLEQWWADPQKEAKYLDQITFVNSKIETLVEDILTESKTPPIIIIQGDHGYREAAGSQEETYRDTFEVLNALYLPGADNTAVYDSISSVNTFRLVFSLYFDGHLLGAHLELLEDRNFLSNAFYFPFYFTEVTNKF